MKIVLDAGHGYNTAGKRTPNGIHEWELNNIVCKLITTKLKEYGVDIIRTDDITGKTDISLANRVRKCNEVKPNLMISIHHNAFKGKWGNHSGTEVLMHTLGTKYDKELASILAPLISSNCKLENRGVKRAFLGVLGCKCTAILCEGGFMDSNIDNSIICSLEGQVNYANAVTEGIVKYLGLKKVVEIKPVIKPKTKDKYQVISDILNCRYAPNSYTTTKITRKFKKGNIIEADMIKIGQMIKNGKIQSNQWVKIKDGFLSMAYLKKV